MDKFHLTWKLIAAAHACDRPRFAAHVALALIAFADDQGIVRATREEIAALIDRTDFFLKKPSKRRLLHLRDNYRTLESKIAETNHAYLNNDISRIQLKMTVEQLNNKFFMAARSPTLSNLSRVISFYKKHGLIDVKYIDKNGHFHKGAARGRIAQYRIRYDLNPVLDTPDQIIQRINESLLGIIINMDQEE